MLNLFLEATGSGCDGLGTAGVPIMIVVAVLLIAVMVIFPMITNRKQKKAVEDQRGKLSIGDTIETVGGIIGVVKEIREPAPGRKELVIETGMTGATTTLVIDIQALYMVLNHVGGDPVAAPAMGAQTVSQENLKLNEKAEKQSVVDPFESDDAAEEKPVAEDSAAAESNEKAEENTDEKPAEEAKPAKSNKKTK